MLALNHHRYANSTTPFVLFTQTNPIPGLTFSGTVQYVTAGPNMSLPGDGHTIQLGTDGKINQTFRANGTAMDYVLTFTLAPGGDNCSTSTTVNVSVPGRSALVALEQQYGSKEWESHACYLGRWGANSGPINLNLRSQLNEADPNITCGPVVDTFILKAIGTPVEIQGNFIVGAQGAQGAQGLKTSHYKAIAQPLPKNDYIAIAQPKEPKDSKLHTNNSCTGNFIVGAQGGPSAQNFTLQSNGTATTQKFSMLFKADSNQIQFLSVSLVSLRGRQKDFAFCGPMIHDVVLHAASCGLKSAVKSGVLFSCIVFIVSALNIIG